MLELDRRAFLATSAVTTVVVPGTVWSAEVDRHKGATFSFGTYGMKSLTTERAVRLLAEIGYDGVELSARPEWDSTPARMPANRRKELRLLMRDIGLQVTGLMVNIHPTDDDSEHARQLGKTERYVAQTRG